MTWDPLNLKTLQEAVEKGRLQPGMVVTTKTLYDAGLLSKKIDHGIKLLGTVSPPPAITLFVLDGQYSSPRLQGIQQQETSVPLPSRVFLAGIWVHLLQWLVCKSAKL